MRDKKDAHFMPALVSQFSTLFTGFYILFIGF